MIEVKGLTKKFGDLTAVQDLDFSIEKGQIFAFLGPNGAGKTTTIRLLSTLISPTMGSITIDGRDSKTNGKYIRSITGFLTETPGMYEDLSAYQNLRFFSDFYEMEESERGENIERFLRMFDLWVKRDTLVKSFSKGMKQKLALARALIHRPKILFLDEPTAGLDPESAYMVRNYIDSLKEKNTTVFLCTHNLEEASSISDRVCIIKRSIIKIASLSELQSGIKGKGVKLVLKKHQGKYLELLKSMDSVKGATKQGDIIELTVERPEDSNPGIIKALIDNGAEILYFNEVRASLEDIYLDLIKKN